ncbi:ATP-binding protein [Streptomyces minutiscleroticus]|uniref:Histidine kinase/HSP90-like ATPase domain-containing protein n=1 Tax=Streptomyces minutiscleroticus TaxID=68238 RepID=A0A918KQL6_9ACTN|nr:ATP-binding protein [Streptomyces minutiscleroticus]GGX72938.1 hypothetical protein GCM10010358_29080 [Streptomyces minutiscleroticus]
MAPPTLPRPAVRTSREAPARQADVFRLPALVTSVGAARNRIGDLLRRWGTSAEACEDALLVTSELVTNVITHTASDHVVCTLRRGEGWLCVEVEEQIRGLTRPRAQRPEPDDPGGRGLLLVAALSRDWGVRETAQGSGRTVWAELPVDEGVPAAAGSAPSPVRRSPDPRRSSPGGR